MHFMFNITVLSLALTACSSETTQRDQPVENKTGQQLFDHVVREFEAVDGADPRSTNKQVLTIINSPDAREFRRRVDEGERDKVRQRLLEDARNAEISRANEEIYEAERREKEEMLERELAAAEAQRRAAVEQGKAREAEDLRLIEQQTRERP